MVPPARGIHSERATDLWPFRGRACGHSRRESRARGYHLLLGEAGVDTEDLERKATDLAAEGRTPILAAADGRPLGALGIFDPVKADSVVAIRRLQALGKHVVILTGDHEATARAVAREVGVVTVWARVLRSRRRTASRSFRSRVAGWPWWVTASTTRRRLPRRMSGSPSGPERMWRWKPPMSRSWADP